MPEKRFAGDDDAFAALVLRFLDGATSPDEEATLNAGLKEPAGSARRDLYVSLCRQRGLLEEAMTASAVRRRPEPPPRRRAPWKLLVGAAAAILAGVAGFLLISKDEPLPVAVVERAGVATPLFAGEGVEGRAVVRFDDGTRIELSAQAQIRSVEAAGGKRFLVARGSVTAEVVKQPAGQPMVLRTPEGESRIVGTKFTLAVKPGSTRLEVERGLVRLTRHSDKKSADVGAGQYAVASADEDPVARSLAAARVRAMAPNTWMSIPDTAMLKVAPDRLKFPDIQGRMGAAAVVAAWSGGAFDTKRNRLILWGGGHTDYHGNEVYAFSVESMSWERVTEPNAAPRLNFELNGDGTPNSRATYNGLAYVAHADRLFAFGGSVAGNGFASCKSTLALDFGTRIWTNRAPGGSNPPPDLGSTCSYDPVTRKTWWGENKGLFSYDYDGNRWAKHTDDEFYYCTSAVDPKRRLWVAVGRKKFFAYDLKGGSPVRQAWTTTGGEGLLEHDNPGLDYDPVRERIVGWAGGAVYALDPDTKAWAAFNASGAPAPTPNGIYGRWRYVPGLDAFVVVTAAGEDVHFYKPGR